MKIFKILLLMVCCVFPFVLNGCANNDTTSLSTPKNLEVKNGIITFKQVEDADYYSVSINDKVFNVDAKYNSNVSLVDGFVNYDANRLFAYGSVYSIKVKARGNDKYDSHYTSVVEYLHNIDLFAPQNVRIVSETLAWDNVSDAAYYIVKAYYKTGDISVEERCDINFCDVSKFLTDNGTGDYQFSVKAVREGINPAESVYSNVVNYTNYQQLATPIISTVSEVSNEITMVIENVDPNANKLTIVCGDVVRHIMFNSLSGNYEKVGSNCNLNITGIFGADKFTELKQYVFTVQAKIETNSSTYYSNSEVSEQFEFNKTQTLSTPTLSVEKDAKSGKFIASWNEIAHAVGYEIELGGETILVDKTTTQFLIESNRFTIRVRAVGAGNYIPSNYSNSITK